MTSLDARALAQRLGGQASGPNRLHCPGPDHSRFDRSLTVWLDPAAPDGFRVHSHAGDDPLMCRDYVRAQLGLSAWRPTGRPDRDGQVPRNRPVDTDNNGVELAQHLWTLRQEVAGTIAETYLRTARHYQGPIPPALGFLPGSRKHPPAMIAAFAIAEEISPGILSVTKSAIRAVHLTKLKSDGSEKADLPAPKIILGRGAKGIPIMLAAPNDRLGLAITEGIEDGLSIREATGLGVWVAGSATRMPALADAVPGYIESVTVIGDNDPAGGQAANSLARRLAERGIVATVKFLKSTKVM